MEGNELTLSGTPAGVLEAAKQAAIALKDVINQSQKKPLSFNGQEYLYYEQWQTLGRFYGITAKVISATYVTYGEVTGFEAIAIAQRADGGILSQAEALCLTDEGQWSKKPLFMLKSMAQTRACAKVLRNVLAWVSVLAGYAGTPAEEMAEVQLISHDTNKKELSEAHKKLWELLKKQYADDKAAIALAIESLTMWTDKNGHDHAGKTSLYELSDKMAQIALSKLKKATEDAI